MTIYKTTFSLTSQSRPDNDWPTQCLLFISFCLARRNSVSSSKSLVFFCVSFRNFSKKRLSERWWSWISCELEELADFFWVILQRAAFGETEGEPGKIFKPIMSLQKSRECEVSWKEKSLLIPYFSWSRIDLFFLTICENRENKSEWIRTRKWDSTNIYLFYPSKKEDPITCNISWLSEVIEEAIF